MQEIQEAVSGEVQAILQMLVEADSKIYGEITKETIEAIQTQGFVLQDGMIQKVESIQAETVQCEQEAISATEKPSVRNQLRTAAKEVGQHPYSKDRDKGGDAR